MVLYLSIIFVFMVVLMLVDIVGGFLVGSMSVTILAIIGAVAIEFAIDGFFAMMIHLCPEKWFGAEKKFFNVGKKERNFYEKIKIRKWKDKVWELGGLGGFSKRHLESSSDAGYLRQFIIESNKGVITHILGCIFGFLLIVLYIPLDCVLSISLPVSIINLFFNLPSLFILRYNTPKLQAGYKRLQRNEQLKHKKEEDEITNKTYNAEVKSAQVNQIQTNSINEEAKV